LEQGHLLLTTAQYKALAVTLGFGSSGIVQWVHLPSGLWISQKNPGYPFFAVLFRILGVLRAAPLFYGALACAGLFAGARRWLGPWGGTWAALLFCSSGAAITFAWRATMPTFTDASLIAAGAGALLWAMLAVEASHRRRLLVGLLAFAAFEGATFIRYTDLLVLLSAAAAVLLLAPRCKLPWRIVASWMSTVLFFGAGVALFDKIVYGSPLKTGYASGEIKFSLSALPANIEHMPIRLLEAMPMIVLAVAALGWIALRLARDRAGRSSPSARIEHRRDGAVALSLLAGWALIWGLYLAYTWTVNQAGADSVHVIRFYLPALGLIALLGAWTLAKLPRGASSAAVVLALIFGVLSFHGLTSGGGPGGPGGGPGALGIGAPAGGLGRNGGNLGGPGGPPPAGTGGAPPSGRGGAP
ncbi:MAG TPA: hypothetical protein VMA86_06345, partial [Acetobacteraceae bacterium]|nr:hypothetical protein [Acetobacteraceae bacterium]